MKDTYPMRDKPETAERGPRCRPDEPCGQEGPVNQMAMRQNARGVLADLIRRKRREADGLEALYNALPLELAPQAEEALWQVLCSHRA